jgi:hypothetical protein
VKEFILKKRNRDRKRRRRSIRRMKCDQEVPSLVQ